MKKISKECCGKGHLFDEKNTYIDPRGKRQCKQCRREAGKRHRDNPNGSYRKKHKKKLSWPESFWNKVEKQENGCWIWRGYINVEGYGKAANNKMAHRVAYQLVIGNIPEGLEIDHLCRNRRCVNPAHLEPVTHTENVKRGDYSNVDRELLGRLQREKTHCPKGHPYTGNNLRINYAGRRVCRECERIKNRQYLARKKRIQ